MVVCIIGEIISMDGKKFTVRDRISSEEIVCLAEGDQILEIQPGDSGCFVGTSYNNTIKVSKVEIRKFLDPLYEDDLLDLSSKHTLLPLIDEPFTEVYKEFLAKNESIE